ncbi:MAG: CapA family protein [Gracilibacteraceae bacterium]|jgi:poly-gamma-glutamate synthesis protein (capsule biosynthesis protein)|nr:CapA family protein [Gracilibacteraceae bacterium]
MKKLYRSKILLLLLGLLLGAALAACAATGPGAAVPGSPGTAVQPPAGAAEETPEQNPDSAASGPAAPDPEAGTAAPPGYTEITLAAAGDVLVHNTIYLGAWDAAAGSYDFRPQYRSVAPLLSSADFAVVDLETTMGGPGFSYSGYPCFNSPDELAAALKDAGIDAVTAANNHRMDTGRKGFFHTIETARASGLEILGVRAAETELPCYIRDIKGVRLAFINFSYCGRSVDGGKNFNGLPLPLDMTNLVNGFVPEEGAAAAAAEIGAVVDRARELGARGFIVFLHWGYEYQRQPNDFQRELARLLVEQGVTAIIGGHPHVIQSAEVLPGPAGVRVPVFYSLGNFISDQRLETLDNIHTEQGMIAWLKLRGYADGRVEAAEAWYDPTWVMKHYEGGRSVYAIIPSLPALAAPGDYPFLSAAELERIRTGVRQTEELIPPLDLSPP